MLPEKIDNSIVYLKNILDGINLIQKCIAHVSGIKTKTPKLRSTLVDWYMSDSPVRNRKSISADVCTSACCGTPCL